MSVVGRILSVAKDAKVSNQEICRLLGANRNKVDDWKKGKSTPTSSEVAVLAKKFDVSTDYLIGLSDAPTPPTLSIPDALQGVPIAFNRGEFEDLTQDEVDNLARIAAGYKALRGK